MNFDQLPGVSIIGPDSKTSERLNIKYYSTKPANIPSHGGLSGGLKWIELSFKNNG